MKKKFFLCTVLSGMILLAQSQAIIKDDLKYCESVLWNNDVMYIANFGSSALDPLNKEGKGYIVQYKEGKVSPFIVADGYLNAPRGMALKNQYLFIADVGAVVVYNITDLKEKPRKIIFPKEAQLVNDVCIDGNTLYATATDAGEVYSLNISDLQNIGEPVEYVKIPGANGIIVANKKMYIVSYNISGKAASENVIYVINNIKAPKPEHLIQQEGLYDGVAISADNKTLYFTNWANNKIGSIDLATKKINYLPTPVAIAGPADIERKGDYLYVPDLVNSVVVPVKIP